MRHAVTITQALADETRLRLLVSLFAREATVSDLAAQLCLPQPRVSTHLALLRTAGLVTAERASRQQVYRVDAARVGPLLDALEAFVPDPLPVGADAGDQPKPPRSAQAERVVQRDVPLRHARSCYDHLAGVTGVRLLDALLQREWLVEQQQGDRTYYHLTAAGERALDERGVDLTDARRGRRLFAYACLDWTERRPHLGGAVGASTLDALTAAGFVRREDAGRTLHVLQPLERWLDG